MGTIYREDEQPFRILSGMTKTAFPEKRHLPRGVDHEDVALGELVGLRPSAGQSLTLEKVTAGNAVDQAANVAMRIDNTRYDTLESGAITVVDGLFIVETELYDPSGSYELGDFVTAGYDSGIDGGVFAPTDGSTTHAIGQVQTAPQDASANTPMRLKVFPAPHTV